MTKKKKESKDKKVEITKERKELEKDEQVRVREDATLEFK